MISSIIELFKKIYFKINKYPFWVQLSLVGLISSLVYYPLLSGFFIQDEWQLFSIFYEYRNKPLLEVIFSFLLPEPGQYVPITQTLSYITFKLFGMNYLGYFLVGIFLHIATGVLLGLLIFKITNNKDLSTLLEILFIIAPQHFQGTTWVIANFGYSFSAIFFILGLMNFLDWLKKDKIKYIFFSSIFLFLSVVSKEITSFIFIGLPLMVIIWRPGFKRIVLSLVIGLPVFLFVFFHYLYIKANPLADYSISNPINIYGVPFLSLKSIAQSVLPQEIIYKFSKIIIAPFAIRADIYPMTSQFDQLVQGIGAQIIVSMFFLLIVLIGGFFYQISKKNKNLKIYFKLYLTGIILSGLSGLPYIFVDTNQFSLLQSRYTYIGVICISFSISAIFCYFQNFLGRKSFILLFIVILYFGVSTFLLSSNLSTLGNIRKNILIRLNRTIPENSKNIILLVESDSNFFGLSSEIKTVPFQNGFGKTAGIYLHKKIYLPNVFYYPDTLWPIQSEGLISDQNGSFGYFREYSELEKKVRNHEIKVDSIYAFIYRDRTRLLLDQTSMVREKLSK